MMSPYALPHTIIAIDPDCEKSGFAIFDGKIMKVECLPFPLLIDRVRQDAATPLARVIVEAGWLNQSHWHLKPGTSLPMAAAIGNSVGRNHQTGRLIVETLRFYGIVVKEVKPLRKFWRGQDHKITFEELNKQLTLRNIPPLKRCSQDARDAALLALTYYD